MKEMKTIDFGNDNVYEIVDQTSRDEIKELREMIGTSGGGNSSKILWEGLVVFGSINFYIPKECFHNRNKIISLVLEFTAANESKVIQNGRDNTALISISTDPSRYASTEDDDNDAYSTYIDIGIEVFSPHVQGDVKIKVKRLNTEDYAYCTVDVGSLPQLSGLTCVYAIVPNEL